MLDRHNMWLYLDPKLSDCLTLPASARLVRLWRCCRSQDPEILPSGAWNMQPRWIKRDKLDNPKGF